MIVLGLESSTARSSVAVLDVPDDAPAATAGGDARVLAADAHEDPRGHGAFLAPAVVACLAEAGCGVRDLGGVAVGTGPGLYTGLRIGMATAVALAWARRVPVAGVGGLDAVAVAARRDPDLATATLVVVLDARRGQWFHATSPADVTDPAPRWSVGPAVGDAAAVAAAVAAAGPGARAVGEVPAAVAAGTGPVRRPDAVDVVRLGAAALRRGGTDPAALAPTYLREADVRIGWAERGGGRTVGS